MPTSKPNSTRRHSLECGGVGVPVVEVLEVVAFADQSLPVVPDMLHDRIALEVQHPQVLHG